MTRIVLRRLAAMLLVLFVVSAITFAIFIVVPGGDPAVRLAGRTPTEQNIRNIRSYWGFDEPVPVQYASMMGRLLDGSLTSYVTHTNVRDELLTRFPVTLTIAVGAAVIWVLLGTAMGVLAALWAGTARDHMLAALALVGLSVPVFWAAIELRYLLSDQLHLLPDGGYVPLLEDPVGWFTHAILPCFVTALGLIAVYSRVLRNTILDVMHEDYVRTARAKGLPEREIWRHHVLRNALLPIVTLLGLDFAAVLGGGTILVEAVFDMHGIGQYAADAVGTLDLPPLMAVTLYGAAIVVVINAAVDLLYAWVDPRVRTSA
jgi:peptide/nickel transport system permease protein